MNIFSGWTDISAYVALLALSRTVPHKKPCVTLVFCHVVCWNWNQRIWTAQYFFLLWNFFT